MNCSSAKKVWGHPQGFIAGLNETFPGVLERLEQLTANFRDKVTNPFHETVTRKAGVNRNYYVEHADDNDGLAEKVHDVVGDVAARLQLEHHLREKFGIQVTLFNLCCSGCGEVIGDITLDDAVAIQNAAVRTEMDGSDIIL